MPGATDECANCGHQFRDHEASVVVDDDDEVYFWDVCKVCDPEDGASCLDFLPAVA